MGTRVLLTVDTELTSRHHRAGDGWERNYSRSVEPARVGLSYKLQQLNKHGLKGVFFVDPMPAALFGIEPIKRMVDTVLSAGQEIQLHLHPMWSETDDEGGIPDDANHELTAFSQSDQQALIAKARELLVEAGAPDPIAFRSGSYAANSDTLRALADLGIRYDSSHNGCEAPWPSALSLDPEWVAPIKQKGVIEIPVSQMMQPTGTLRHMQICAVTLGEMKAGLEFAVANDHPVFTIISHSFELATRDGRRANKIARRRFDGLCAYLAERRDEAPTKHFSDLGGICVETEAEPAVVSPVRVVHRMAEQLWSNVIEERGT